MALGAAERMNAAGIQSLGMFGPSMWRDGRILFSNNQTMWSVAVDEEGWLAGALERLTFGTSLDSDPTSGPGGLIAFTSAISEGAIWALPLDAEKAQVTGPAERITDGAGPHLRPSASLDGTVVAYHLSREKRGLLMKNLVTGAVTDLGTLGEAFGSALSPDGSLVAYMEDPGIKVMSVRGGPATQVCDNCSLGEWLHDNRRLVVIAGNDNADTFRIVDAGGGAAAPVISAPGAVLNRPHPSPDGRLIAFREGATQGNSIWVARLDPNRSAGRSDWIPVVAKERDARPCGWSPGGRVLYFASSRDGNRCLYAQRLDPATARPDGPPVLVKHFHEARNFRIGQSGVLSTGPTNAVRAGKFFYDLFTIRADIWTLRPAAR